MNVAFNALTQNSKPKTQNPKLRLQWTPSEGNKFVLKKVLNL